MVTDESSNISGKCQHEREEPEETSNLTGKKKKYQPPQAGETPPADASRLCLHHRFSLVSKINNLSLFISSVNAKSRTTVRILFWSCSTGTSALEISTCGGIRAHKSRLLGSVIILVNITAAFTEFLSKPHSLVGSWYCTVPLTFL